MKPRSRYRLSSWIARCALGLALVGTPALHASEGIGAGVVVERVVDGWAAHKGGLQPGDVIVAWERAGVPPANTAPAGGPVSSPFELDDVDLEQSPRGAVTLVFERAGERRHAIMSRTRWAVEVRPQLPDDFLVAYLEAAPALSAADAGKASSAADACRALAAELVERGQAAHAAWLLLRVARAESRGGRLDRAAADFASAAALGEPLRAGWVAQVKSAEAAALERQNARIERALELRREAVRLREQVDTDSLATASALNNLGILNRDLGDLPAADACQRRALGIHERHAPGSMVHSHSLNNVGNVAWSRGDLATAEAYLQQGLELRRKLAPDGSEVAQSLNNLGSVAWTRHDLAAARRYFEEALRVQDLVGPDTIESAAMLTNLGSVEFESARPAEAERFFQRALAIEQRLSPDGIEVAGSLVNLGQAAAARGATAPARQYLTRALALQESLAPLSLTTAEIVRQLGDLDLAEGHLATAEAHHRRALALRGQAAPGSLLEAESYHDLARVHRAAGRYAAALEAAQRALTALESQSAHLGGAHEARSRFLSRHAGYYRDTIELLRRDGRPEEAFHVLERSRARGLLALLAERDLVFSDIPEEIAREQREADAEYDRVFAQVEELTGEGGEAERRRQELRDRLDGVRLRQEELRARVRRATPRLAELQQPQPLDLDAARLVLDRGTLALAYSLGSDSSVLFALGPGEHDFAAFDLGVGEATLRDEVQAFREQMLRGRHGAGSARLRWLAQELSLQLLAPVADRIARAQRLVVQPEGPLHALPFAALADPTAPVFRHLVEARPLHVVASATVFAQLAARRREGGSRGQAPVLVAFGDPAYPAALAAGARAAAEPVLRSFLDQGLRLRPLPGSRAEVESLRDLFPGHAQVFLGDQATEEQARGVGRGPRFVHFACHGLADNRSPLDSALVLSIPEAPGAGRANGLLQAWEIFEHVRLDAELVTLSACETALGEEQAGEGMLGLTRAFHFAGARSVLASLWAVGDAPTARLMERFYRALRSGLTKDEALRAAQIDALHDAERAQPVHWAAFQLFGDWR